MKKKKSIELRGFLLYLGVVFAVLVYTLIGAFFILFYLFEHLFFSLMISAMITILASMFFVLEGLPLLRKKGGKNEI